MLQSNVSEQVYKRLRNKMKKILPLLITGFLSLNAMEGTSADNNLASNYIESSSSNNNGATASYNYEIPNLANYTAEQVQSMLKEGHDACNQFPSVTCYNPFKNNSKEWNNIFLRNIIKKLYKTQKIKKELTRNLKQKAARQTSNYYTRLQKKGKYLAQQLLHQEDSGFYNAPQERILPSFPH